jgi:TolB-like protein/Flp pilus assembly protein TadD
VVGKDELMRRVWGDLVVTEDSLVQTVGDIRRVLGDSRHERVRTVPRRGYVLTLPPAAGPSALAADGPRRRRLALLLSGLVLVVAAAGLAALWQSGIIGAPPAASLRSLAILPFESADAAADDTWFADALTGDLTSKAARWQGVFVIGAGTMRGYKGKRVDPRQVARELNVQYVMTGSVRRDGDQVRLDVALIDGASGRAAWSEQIDVPRAELPRSVGDIAGGMAKVLTIGWGEAIGERVATLKPAEAEADDIAMRGFAVHLRSLGPDNLEQARVLFEQALAKDERSLRALAGVSMVNSMNIAFGWSKDVTASQRRSQEALDRMATIDNHSQLTLMSRASLAIARSDWKTQHATAEELVRGWPNDPTSYHHRCSSLLRLGGFDEAIPACDRAIKISPRDSRTPTWHALAGMNEYMRGRYAAAAERAGLAVAGNAKVPGYSLLLAAALAEEGRLDEARQAIADLKARHPGYDRARLIGLWSVANTHPRFATGMQRKDARARDLGFE